MSPSKSASVWPILLLFVALPYFRHEAPSGFSSDELATLYLTRALVEQGSVKISEQVKKHGDLGAKVVVDGESYSALAPGLAFLAVPAFAAAKVVAWVFGAEVTNATAMRWLRLALAQLPAAIVALIFFFFLVRRGVHAQAARLGVLAIAALVPLMHAATTLDGGFTAALCVLLCLVLLGDETDWPQQASFVGAGLLLAIAVVCCRTAVFALPLLFVYGAGRARNPRWIVPFVGLAALGAVGLGVYQYYCFGSAFFVPHASGAATFWGLPAPGIVRVWRLFVANDGILRSAPLLAIAVVGFVFMLGRGDSGESAVLAITAGVALLFTNTADGASVAFALVLCLWPLARGVEAMTSVAGGAFVVGVLGSWSLLITALVAATHIYLPESFANPLRDLSWAMFQQGVFAQSVGHLIGLSGYYAVLPFWLVLFAIAYVIAAGGASPQESSGAGRTLSVILIAAAALIWQLSWKPDPHPRERFLYTQQIVQRLEAARPRPDSRIARAATRASESAPGTPETLLLVGHAATAAGDNPRALDAYRQLPPP